MSFSNDVKNELARIGKQELCCDKAELFGLLRMSGAVILRGKNMGINFSTENAALARRILSMLKTSFGLLTEVVVTRSRRLKKNNRYQVRVIPSSKVADTLRELKIFAIDEKDLGDLLKKNCCKRAFLRGAFMGGGYISRPSADYHLEMVTENENFSRMLAKAMKSFGLIAKLTDRKNDFIVYLKEGNAITSFLSVIGAHGSLLEFENVRIVKEMRNNVNRIVNCETANLGKTIKAAMEQVRAIKFIEANGGLEILPVNLIKAARIRLENQDASLAELVEAMDNEVGKSGINHRLKKIEKIANEMGMKNNEKKQ